MVSAPAPSPPQVTERCLPAEWDTYVQRHPDAALYHSWAFRTVFERALGHQCHYLAAFRAESLVGVLPVVEIRSRLFGHFGVSLPFVNYGGVLADDEEAANALLAEALVRCRKGHWRHVELRHMTRAATQWPARSHKVIMERQLEANEDALWASIERKTRNLVRKAEKSGCNVEAGGAELLPDFYSVFATNMRDLGTPVLGRAFFSEVMAAAGHRGCVFVVRVGRTAVAASLVLQWRDRVEVPWASSLRSHAALSPNMLLYWGMLRWSVAQGRAVFDFGRSTPGEGTYRFKQQWGAQPRPCWWEYLGLSGDVPDHSPGNPKFRAAIAAWKRLPLPVANRLGPAIVRNIP
jgi:serine/alanine adding enzyme